MTHSDRARWLPLLILTGACARSGAAVGPLPPPSPVDAGAPYVVVVSFDGMRYDALDRVETPNFDRVARAGVRAAALIPSYPSKTFPNHYTLATGLYPSHHGIVDNTFYDPLFEATYSMADTTAVRDARWYEGEPLWVTAETQGVKAATYYWVGSEAPIDGVRPSYSKPYRTGVPFEARVDTVLHWLSLAPAERPHLVMLYVSEPDHTGHVSGPASPAVDSVVRELDATLGRLLDGLAELPIAGRVDVVLVSDHGMAEVPPDSVVYLDDAVELEGIRALENTTQTLFYFEGHEERLWAVYDPLRERLEHATAYLAEETPERWHYRDNRRIGELVVAASPGWVIRTRADRPWTGGGMHGWDPYFRPMQGIFLAAGPDIVAGRRIGAFENIHVYPFLVRLLGLDAPPDLDGRLDVLEGLVRTPAPAR